MKYDKNITEQDIVDEYAMNINKALEKANTLKEIETDNKFDIDVRRRNLLLILL